MLSIAKPAQVMELLIVGKHAALHKVNLKAFVVLWQGHEAVF